MKPRLIGLLAIFALMLPAGAFAGCDHDVADSDLVVAEQMTEQQILDLVADTRAAGAIVEQAETQTDK